MKALLAAFLLLLTTVFGLTRTIHPPPPYFDSFAQDGTGKIWATSRAEYGCVYSFDGQAWKENPISFPEPERLMPATLVSAPDGSVIGLWRVDATHMAVTRHQGKSSEVTGRFEAEVPGSGLRVKPYCDSKGRVWITSNAPLIHRLEAGGKELSTFPLPEEILAHPKGRKGQKRPSDGFNLVETVEDGKGAVWLWSVTHASNYTSLKGFYRFDETGWRHIAAIPGIEKMRFSCVVPKDASQLWAATCDGLFNINTDTLEATPILEPEPGAFAEVFDLFQHGGQWHAIALPRRAPTRRAALWRLQEDGWKKLVPEFDTSASDRSRHWPRILYSETLLLSAQDGGPWILPPGKEPFRLTWRNRFPLESVSFIAPLGGDRLFMAGRGGLFAGALELPPPLYDTTRVSEFPTPRAWSPDPAGHLWAIRADLADSSNTPWPLREWTGKEWLQHVLPGEQSANNYTIFKVDTKNRVWLHSNSDKRPTFIYHPKEKLWEEFPDTRSAFLAYRSDPPEWFALKPHNAECIARYRKDGKALAFVKGTTLHYFDGEEWRSWPRKEIAAKSTGIQQAPYFDAGGKLYAQFNNEAWRLEEDGTWRSVPLEPARHIENRLHSPPEWFPESTRDAYAALDNTGTYWITSNQRLYRARDGNWVPVFKDDEPDPFLAGRVIFDAWQDAAGNVILNSAGANGKFVRIAPQYPPPNPQIHVSIFNNDQAKLTLEGEEIYRWLWRLDDGPWQRANREEINLIGMPNGKHRVEAKAMNRELVEASAGATFTITVDRKQQLARLIALLNDPDYELRKQALAGLARQPKAARKALRAALEKTNDDDHRWWLTAALQEVERILKKGPADE